jgi:YbbR domain-containing protein
MRRFWNERSLYLLLSVAIAVLMWLYVATGQNPTVPRTMKVDLQVRNLDPNEVLIQPSLKTPVPVVVKLQGPRSQIAPLIPKLVDAYVDLGGFGPGIHQVPVTVVPQSLDVRVVEQKPTSVLVELDALASKRLPVEVNLQGTPRTGVRLGSPHTTPTHVIVSGPSRQVDQVRSAVVSIDTGALRQQVAASLRVVPVDASGQPVPGIQVTPSIVDVTLAVREVVISKVVPIVPTLVGTPQQGLAVTSTTVEPQTVVLTAPSALLQGVEEAATLPVNVSGARSDFTRRVGLRLPAGISSSVGQVTVAVRIGKGLLSRIFRAVPVRVVGTPAGTASRVVPDRVDVQVEGPQDLVQRLTVQAVTVEVGAGGRGVGQYTMNLRAVLPRGIHVLTIQPAQVVVILSSS